MKPLLSNSNNIQYSQTCVHPVTSTDGRDTSLEGHWKGDKCEDLSIKGRITMAQQPGISISRTPVLWGDPGMQWLGPTGGYDRATGAQVSLMSLWSLVSPIPEQLAAALMAVKRRQNKQTGQSCTSTTESTFNGHRGIRAGPWSNGRR